MNQVRTGDGFIGDDVCFVDCTVGNDCGRSFDGFESIANHGNYQSGGEHLYDYTNTMNSMLLLSVVRVVSTCQDFLSRHLPPSTGDDDDVARSKELEGDCF